MSFNNLILENIENSQYNIDPTQKLLATPATELSDYPEMVQFQKFGYEGNLNMMPSPELESNLSSPSSSYANNEDDLDLLNFPLYIQEQENYPFMSIPNEITNMANLSSSPMIYPNQMLNLMTTSQINDLNYDPLLGMNNDVALLNIYQMYLASSLKNPQQNMLNNPLDLNSNINFNTFDQFINTSSNLEIPPLISSNVEPNLTPNNLMDSLLYSNNTFTEPSNEINGTEKGLNSMYKNTTTTTTDSNMKNVYEQQNKMNQINTPPSSPLYLNKKELESKMMTYPNNKLLNGSIQTNNINNLTCSCGRNDLLKVPNKMIDTCKLNSMNEEFINDNKPKYISTSLNENNMTSKINNNLTSPLSSVTLKNNFEKKQNTKITKMNRTTLTSLPKEEKKVKCNLKARNVNKIQKVQSTPKPQIKHTFVIETPGENYGKKSTGRRRRNKKDGKDKEAEEENSIQQFPQVPSRPIVLSLPPQKLSKIRARMSEDLDSRPFQCEFCPSAFSRKHDLKRHIRIHLGIKPYKCENCGKCFARLDALNRHNAVKGCKAQLESNKLRQINKTQ